MIRRGTFATLGVALVVLGVALVVLGAGCGDAGGEARAGGGGEPGLDFPRERERRVDPPPGPRPAGERGAGPVDDVEHDLDHALARRVESAVARAVERAGARSRGRVGPDDVVVAVHARELDTGRVVVARQDDLALVPASNLKVLTVACAFVHLGADAAFETTFEAAGEVRGGVLHGDLVARAGGDPMYDANGDGGIERWTRDLAAQLRTAGIERVAGALVLDEGTWLEPEDGPAWPSESERWNDYCARAGGFSANGGCLRATIRPGDAVGAPARVTVGPRHHGLSRRGSVTTGAPGSRNTIAVGANAGGVTVRGSIPRDARAYRADFRHPDPVSLHGHAVVGGLRSLGLEVEQGFRRERGAPGGRVVATLRTPIDEALRPILLDSNNPVSDQLFFLCGVRAGGGGDREGGARAVAAALRALGVPAGGLVVVDGSGLSKDNRVSAAQLAAVTAATAALGPDEAAALREALPLAGRTGRLERRMRGTSAVDRVFGKTGFVAGASGLTGLAETLDGRTLAYSILVAYPPVGGLNTHAWKPMQDEICAALVESDGGDR